MRAPKPTQKRKSTAKVSPPKAGRNTNIARRFENIEFRVLSDAGASYLKGVVIIDGDQMALEIRHPKGHPYTFRAVGLNGTYSARESNPPDVEPVRAAWTKLGREYVGTWLEQGYDGLFSFTLPS